MKKALALIMAIAMVASMAAVSFAATQLGSSNNGSNPVRDIVPVVGTLHVYDGGYLPLATDDLVPFGETVYLQFIDETGAAAKADAVKGLKASAKWTENGEYIKSVEIVKYKDWYVVAIATTGSSLDAKQVVGELSIKGQSYYEVKNGNKLEGEKQKVDYKTDVEIKLGYYAYPNAVTADITADDVYTVYDFSKTGTVDELDVKYGDLTAEISTKGMKKVLVGFDTEENEELFDAYIDADLKFLNCVGAFRRTATVTVDATEYPYLYEVVDGELVAVDAEYDEWTEEFTFKTRTLGNYVLSDTELAVAEEVVATNPSTGAAA